MLSNAMDIAEVVVYCAIHA